MSLEFSPAAISQPLSHRHFATSSGVPEPPLLRAHDDWDAGERTSLADAAPSSPRLVRSSSAPAHFFLIRVSASKLNLLVGTNAHKRFLCPLRLHPVFNSTPQDYSSKPENFSALVDCREEVCKALGLDEAEVELSMGEPLRSCCAAPEFTRVGLQKCARRGGAFGLGLRLMPWTRHTTPRALDSFLQGCRVTSSKQLKWARLMSAWGQPFSVRGRIGGPTRGLPRQTCRCPSLPGGAIFNPAPAETQGNRARRPSFP